MRNFEKHQSRHPNFNRYQPKDALPRRRTILLTLLLSLLVSLPAFLSISCGKQPSPAVPDNGRKPEIADSTLTVLKFRSPGEYPVKSLQVLVYKSEGTRSLEKMMTFEELPDSVGIMTTVGEKLVAAVANSPKALSPVALDRYDSLKELGYEFGDEDCSCPVMSGQCTTVSQSGGIALKPLLCQVVVSSISNTMDDYELVESPRVRLTGISCYAPVMQEEDFLPTEIAEYGEWADLPYDIGMFTQNPGTTLFCYPNESSGTSLGGVNTAIELECFVMGQLCSFTENLPPFGRGSKLLVDITVDGPYSCRFRITEEKALPNRQTAQTAIAPSSRPSQSCASYRAP